MSDISKIEDQKAKAQKTLAVMLDYLGLDATLNVEEKGSKLAIKVASEDAGRIIGRKGQTLESLQLLLNRIMFKGDEECPRIMLDIDGYARKGGKDRRDDDGSAPEGRGEPRERRERRDRRDRNSVPEEQLISQAQDAAKEVKRWGQPVTLPKMNAHDRRIIHITLQDDPEITTLSEGEGSLKKVVINLKKD